MNPYTYLIKCNPTQQFYYGVRYANKKQPEDDLWKEYFTSSTYVKELIKQYGKDSFEIQIRRTFNSKEDAVKWEKKVLQHINLKENLDKWINRSVAGLPIMDANTRQKISNSLKGRKGKKHSEESKRKISEYWRKRKKVINDLLSYG